MDIDSNIRQLLDFLNDMEIKTYLVGGYVRDTFLGIRSYDYDIVVNVPIGQIMNLLRQRGYVVVDTSGFGTIAVMFGTEKVDIAEFRGDIYDMVTRKPKVYSVKTIEEDLRRRDFTINSMAFEYPSGKLIDPFGGRNDLLVNKTLRTVRDASTVFQEDALRIMRAIRFSSKYSLSIQPILASLKDNMRRLNTKTEISRERIREELLKGFSGSGYVKYAELLIDTGILETIIPELSNYKEIRHDSRGHHYGETLAQHSIDVISRYRVSNSLYRLIAFLHDIGKTTTKSTVNNDKGLVIHYIGHDKTGAELIRKVLTNLRFTTKEINLASKIIENHLVFAQLEKVSKPKKTLAKFFIEQGEDFDFIRTLIPITEADQMKDYSSYEKTLLVFSLMPKILSGSDVLFLPSNLRSIALERARYYQFIGIANNKDALLHILNSDYQAGTLTER